MSFFLFLSYLFLISPCPHSCVYLQYRTIVQINSQTRRSNSSEYNKTITSILLLSVVLLKAIHAMSIRTKFILFVSICVPPNNPITACGVTSFPGYHSFPKWAIPFYQFSSKKAFWLGAIKIRNYVKPFWADYAIRMDCYVRNYVMWEIGLTRSLFILYVHKHDRLALGMLSVETAAFDCI